MQLNETCWIREYTRPNRTRFFVLPMSIICKMNVQIYTSNTSPCRFGRKEIRFFLENSQFFSLFFGNLRNLGVKRDSFWKFQISLSFIIVFLFHQNAEFHPIFHVGSYCVIREEHCVNAPKWTEEPDNMQHHMCTMYMYIDRHRTYRIRILDKSILVDVDVDFYGMADWKPNELMCYMCWCWCACMHVCTKTKVLKSVSVSVFVLYVCMSVCVCVRQLSAVDHHDDDVYMRQRNRKRWNKKTQTSSETKKSITETQFIIQTQSTNCTALCQFVFESRRLENRK